MKNERSLTRFMYTISQLVTEIKLPFSCNQFIIYNNTMGTINVGIGQSDSAPHSVFTLVAQRYFVSPIFDFTSLSITVSALDPANPPITVYCYRRGFMNPINISTI